MAASNSHLVDDFETSFQNCISALTNQEYFNINDQDEVKTSVEQSIQKFLDVAKQMECFFLQKRLLLSVHVPEYIIKEDITELRNELLRKEMLIQKNQEKLQNWQTMLTSQRGGHSHSGGAAGPSQQSMPHPQQQQQQQPHPMQVSSSQGPSLTGAQSVGPQTPTQSMPPPLSQGPAYPQGPLAFLERTTSNIGLPDGRS